MGRDMKTTLKYKFLNWIKRVIESELREMYLSYFGVDTKCPVCQKWDNEKYIDDCKDEYESLDFGYKKICVNCGEISYWNIVAFPFPALCDSIGRPCHCLDKNKRHINAS